MSHANIGYNVNTLLKGGMVEDEIRIRYSYPNIASWIEENLELELHEV